MANLSNPSVRIKRTPLNNSLKDLSFNDDTLEDKFINVSKPSEEILIPISSYAITTTVVDRTKTEPTQTKTTDHKVLRELEKHKELERLNTIQHHPGNNQVILPQQTPKNTRNVLDMMKPLFFNTTNVNNLMLMQTLRPITSPQKRTPDRENYHEQTSKIIERINESVSDQKPYTLIQRDDSKSDSSDSSDFHIAL